MELGAARAVNVLKEEAQEAALPVLRGERFRALRFSGQADRCIRSGDPVTSPGGAIILLYDDTRPATLSTHPIVAKELRILGSVNYDMRDFLGSVEILAQGRIPVDRIITHEFPLERAGEAFRMLDERKENAIKTLIYF